MGTTDQARRAGARPIRRTWARLLPAAQRTTAQGEQGQAMVEFAVVLSVLMLIVTGILYFGRYMNYDIDETHIANVAARMAATGCPSTTTGCTDLTSYAQGLATTSELQNGSSDVTSPLSVYVYPTDGGSSVAYGEPVTACVTAQFKLLPIIDGGPSISVTRWATIMAEATNSWTANPPPAGSGCP